MELLTRDITRRCVCVLACLISHSVLLWPPSKTNEFASIKDN